MSDKPVHERTSHRIMVYVGTAGKLANQFSIEDIIKEELKPMESQLREADVTATAMGLAYSEMKQENARLREALSDLRSCSCDATSQQMHRSECAINVVDEALNHSGDANKMVAGALPKLNWKKLRDLAWERHGINLPDDHSHAILESLALECAIAEPANTGGKEGA